MRAIFVGASATTIATARSILKRGKEVIIVDSDRDKIESIKESLDCGFIHGDGSSPGILREMELTKDDTLFALTDNDQINILTSLVGRSLEVGRTITKIRDPELEHVCLELGLSDTIIPSRTIGRYLTDKFILGESFELSTMLRSESRLFTFVANDEHIGTAIDDLKLPSASRVICLYRDEEFLIPEADTKLEDDDEVVIICHEKSLDKLKELYAAKKSDSPE
ncbi:MAG: TrkA family potassium uptake protein [Ketobacteraceae bacterium]|nr:TrkA family potassium uptake protein [Ketobacteraceae bacterium]